MDAYFALLYWPLSNCRLGIAPNLPACPNQCLLSIAILFCQSVLLITFLYLPFQNPTFCFSFSSLSHLYFLICLAWDWSSGCSVAEDAVPVGTGASHGYKVGRTVSQGEHNTLVSSCVYLERSEKRGTQPPPSLRVWVQDVGCSHWQEQQQEQQQQEQQHSH